MKNHKLKIEDESKDGENYLFDDFKKKEQILIQNK